LLAGLLLAALSLHAHAAPRAAAPRNVILLIGDGMGFAQTTLARIALGDANAALEMDGMRFAAFVKTHPADVGDARGILTDSAAAATALATGHKTKNGMLAVLPDGRPVQTILEGAQAKGKRVGLVTTVTITHATPAGFGAHVGSRGDEAEIAAQYLARKIDVLMGGGEAFFIPQSAEGSKRKDSRDLIAEARAAGYGVVRTRDEMMADRSDRLLGLFNKGYLTVAPPEPSVAEMTEKALAVLGRSPKGFFLMAEGGQIDSACHGNDGPKAVKQTLDFDAAVGVALAFARKRGDTLVIVTADHETGGLSIVSPPSGSSAPYAMAWGTKGHSATVVPLLADGPGADRFSGVLDNTDVAKRIAALWSLKLD